MTTHTRTRIGQLECTVVRHPECTTATGAVILCHGYGAPGTDLVSIADEMFQAGPDIADVIFVFPQAPIQLDPIYESRAWWNIDLERIQRLMLTGQLHELRNSVPDRLHACRAMIQKIAEHVMTEYELSAERMVVGGFSQGAMLSTDVALHAPEEFGGLVVWSGSLINETDWTAAIKSRKKMRVVQSHGRLDPILPFAGGELLRDLFQDNSLQVEFIEFNGPHTISMDALIAALQLIKDIAAH